jgi:NADH dehydrogenase FAD-containing subunit
VTEIDAHRKTLRVHGYDDAIHFDYLVIATGTSYAFPLKVAEPTVARLAGLLDGFAGEVKRARKVVVVGGGPVGIELCGEIRDAHPNTEIVLVHSDGALVSGVPNTAFRQSLAERLAKVGVSVLLNERVVVPDEARRPGDDASASASSTYSTESSESYTDYGPADGPTTATPGLRYLTGRRDLSLRSGKVIPSADLVVFATGAATNSSCYLRSGFNLGQRERLVTDEFLRVTGAGSVMAATHRLKLFLCKKKKKKTKN